MVNIWRRRLKTGVYLHAMHLLIHSFSWSINSHMLNPYHGPSISWDMEIQDEGTRHLVKRQLLIK